MKQIVISKLLESFSELERAISAAKLTLGKKPNTPKVMFERIACYEEILGKQRVLSREMCQYAVAGNWDEVGRHVRLINAYSTMIRDDAREVLSGMTPAEVPMSREVAVC